MTYYVVSTDPEALEQRVGAESALVSISPTVFDQVYAVEVAREDTAALERLREAPEVMAALRFLFFCH